MLVRDVPSKLVWKNIFRRANTFHLPYAMTFRRWAVNPASSREHEMMRFVWTRAGREQAILAKRNGKCATDAQSVAETFYSLYERFAGPELKSRGIERLNGDAAVVTIQTCPMLRKILYSGSMEKWQEKCNAATACVAFNNAAVHHLNQKYEMRYKKAMCAGDSYCEFFICPHRQRDLSI